MLNLESDEMTLVQSNDSLYFNFHSTFANSIPKCAIFVKEAF